MMGWAGTGALGWIGVAGMIVAWFGLVVLVVWGVTAAMGRRERAVPSEPPAWDSAVASLRERFAQGDITAGEYEQARKILDDTAVR